MVIEVIFAASPGRFMQRRYESRPASFRLPFNKICQAEFTLERCSSQRLICKNEFLEEGDGTGWRKGIVDV